MAEFQAAQKILPENPGIEKSIKNLEKRLKTETYSDAEYTES